MISFRTRSNTDKSMQNWNNCRDCNLLMCWLHFCASPGIPASWQTLPIYPAFAISFHGERTYISAQLQRKLTAATYHLQPSSSYIKTNKQKSSKSRPLRNTSSMNKKNIFRNDSWGNRDDSGNKRTYNCLSQRDLKEYCTL